MKSNPAGRTRFLPFQLKKSYLDLTDKEGNCFIVYQAEIRSFLLKLTYSGLISCGSGTTASELSSIRRNHVLTEGRTIALSNNGLNLAGRWGPSLCNKRAFAWYEPGTGRLEWSCHHPKAATMIRLNGKSFRGYGYAETITMNFKPSRLPLSELRWGRFLSRDNVVIWIEWKGRQPLNLVFHNECEHHDAMISENGLSFGNNEFRLRFTDPVSVRSGKLESVVRHIPVLRLLFRKSILNSVEKKFKSPTILEKNNMVLDSGWSLYETVIWKN
jgi:hypothetical protein